MARVRESESGSSSVTSKGKLQITCDKARSSPRKREDEKERKKIGTERERERERKREEERRGSMRTDGRVDMIDRSHHSPFFFSDQSAKRPSSKSEARRQVLEIISLGALAPPFALFLR